MSTTSLLVYAVKVGTTPVLNMTLTDNTDPDQPAIDNLSGSTLFFTVKKSKTDSDANAVIAKKWTPVSQTGYDITIGQTFVPLSSSDTNLPVGSYVWDVREIKASGTIMNGPKGTFIVELPITTRTS